MDINLMEIGERTNNLFNIFKFAIALNEYAFAYCEISEIIEELETLAKIDESYYSRKLLEIRIKAFCEIHDTGILY